MPAQPPSDDPQLPKLRRFRLESDGSKVAREVTSDSTPEPAADQRPYDDPDRLLDATATHRPEHQPIASTPPPPMRQAPERGSAPQAAPSSARAPQRSDGPSTHPAITAPGPYAEPAPTPSKLPLILGGIAAAAVLALVAWLVLKPADDTAAGNGGTKSDEATGSVAVEQWAGSVCTAMQQFETTSMPLRAAATQAAAGSPTPEDIANLQRESSVILSDLATELEAVGMPSNDKDAAKAHADLLAAIADSVSASKSQGGIGSLRDRAISIGSALDTPVVTFVESLAALPDEAHAEVSNAQACSNYL